MFGAHFSRLWRGAPAFDVLRGVFESASTIDEREAKRKAERMRAKEDRPRKAHLSAGEILQQANTVDDTVQDRTAAANAQRASDLLKELKPLVRRAPAVKLSCGRVQQALPLVQTIIDPWSFTQSVENTFFFATLVKDRRAGVQMDAYHNPVIIVGEDTTISPAGGSTAASTDDEDDGSSRAKRQRSAATLGKKSTSSTHQFVWNLDRPSWRAAVEAFGIKEPVLTHRDSADSCAPPGAKVVRFFGSMPHRRVGARDTEPDSQGNVVVKPTLASPARPGSSPRRKQSIGSQSANRSLLMTAIETSSDDSDGGDSDDSIERALRASQPSAAPARRTRGTRSAAGGGSARVGGTKRGRQSKK